MPSPVNSQATGGRLSGEDMQAYMESFADRFLKDSIRYGTDVLRIRRRSLPESRNGCQWVVTMRDLKYGNLTEAIYDKIVLCSGVSFPPSRSTSFLEASLLFGRDVTNHIFQTL